MATREQVAFITEGSLGDSLIALPSLRVLLSRFTVHLISLDPSSKLNATTILGPRLPFASATHFVSANPATPIRRALPWLRVALRIRRAGCDYCFYGKRPERLNFIDRAKAHQRLLRLSGARFIGPSETERSLLAAYATGSADSVSLGRAIFLRTCAGFDLDPSTETFDSSLPLLPSDHAEAARWRARVLPFGPRYFGVCMGGKAETQRWPSSRHEEVLRRLRDTYRSTPIFLGAAEDSAAACEMIARIGFGIDATSLSIGGAAALLAKAEFYLGHDTGTMHLAAAVGCPVVGIFAARNPRGQWYPLGSGHRVLRAEIDCQGCYLNVCRERRNACLTAITVPDVVRACQEVIAEGDAARLKEQSKKP